MASMKLPKGMRLKPEDCALLGDDICRMIRAVLAEVTYKANGTVTICSKQVTIKEEAMIEMGKLYRTRDGKPVRLECIDGEGLLCVHGFVTWPTIGDQRDEWTIDGYQLDILFPTDEDLVPLGAAEL